MKLSDLIEASREALRNEPEQAEEAGSQNHGDGLTIDYYESRQEILAIYEGSFPNLAGATVMIQQRWTDLAWGGAVIDKGKGPHFSIGASRNDMHKYSGQDVTVTVMVFDQDGGTATLARRTYRIP